MHEATSVRFFVYKTVARDSRIERSRPCRSLLFRMMRIFQTAGLAMATAAFAEAQEVGPEKVTAPPPVINELAVLGEFDGNGEPSDRTMRRGDAFATYYRSLVRRNAGDIKGALEDMQKTLALDPDNLTLADETAHTMANNGKPASAIKLYEDWFKNHRDKQEAFLRLSNFYSAHHSGDEGMKKRALEVLEEAHAAFPESLRVFEALNSMLLSRGHRQKARDLAEGLTTAESKSPKYWLRVAAMAREIWPVKESDENKQKINALYEKARKLAPKDRAVNGTVGDYYAATRQYGKAKKVYRAMIDLYPDALREREKLVRVYRITKEKDKALEELKALVRINSQRPTTQKLLAEMYEELGEYSKAVDHFAELLKMGEPGLEDYRKLADLCYKAGRNADAVKYLRRARALSPDSIEAIRMLAEALQTNGDHADAVAEFEAAEAIADKDEDLTLDESFYFNFGLAAAQAKMTERAEDLLRKAIELVPEDKPELAAKSLNQLGYMWLEQDKNIDQAGVNIKRALELEPGKAAYLDSLGWFHFLKGDSAKALEKLLEAKEAMENPDAAILDHLAQVYFDLGKKDEAIEHLEQAIELDPKNTRLTDRLIEFSK